MQENNEKRVIIIGGGPAGLTTAYELCQAGIKSVVFEKDDIVGGISRTVEYKGFNFDIGGHRFFTKVKAVDDRWREVIGENFLRRKRLSRIYYNKKFFYYPLKATNALISLGFWKSNMVLLSYIYSQLFPKMPEDTFETWVSNRFGKHLYNIFFKNYTEKVWGIPCNEISAEWAAQRIKGLSLISAIKDALMKQKYNSDKLITTLIDQFDYPKKGPGMMWEAFAGAIQQNGSQILMNTNVEKMLCKNNKITSVEVNTANGREVLYGSHFVSSMPIKELILGMEPAPPSNVVEAATKLKYRDFITVVLIIDKKDVFPDNWIYVHDPDVRVGRLQNYKNWSPYMVPDQDQTCLGLEYFCFENDEFWSKDDTELIEIGINELSQLGFADKSNLIDGTVVRMPKTYPIYDADYQEALNTIRQYIDSIENLQVIGRNGMHRYNNMDHSMLTAMLAAENIQGSNHNLWAVNADDEYHEEVYQKEERELDDTEQIIIRTFARIDKLGLATAIGCFSGLSIFLANIILLLKGGAHVGQNLQLLNQYFYGYSVSLTGAFIGMGYSFFTGFTFGWFFAYVRNLIIAIFIFRIKRRLEMLTFRDFLDHF